MTKQDRKKLGILILLVAVLGMTWLLSYRLDTPASADEIKTPETAAPPNALPTPSDARIRLDIVDTPEDAQNAGSRNLFRYREAPPPPPPAVKTGPSLAIPSQPVTPPVATTPVKPPPPPIPLQYQGFAVDRSADGGYVAFLAEGATKHYNVKAGEVLMGRYRIARISATSVEVEDLEYNRRQTLPLLK